MTQGFRKPEPIRTRRDFLRVQSQGKRFKRRHMMVMVAPSPTGRARVGYTVSRKVGKAVARNRVRRRLKEITRTHPELLGEGQDHVVVAFPQAADADFATLEDELTWLLGRARSSSSSSSP